MPLIFHWVSLCTLESIKTIEKCSFTSIKNNYFYINGIYKQILAASIGKLYLIKHLKNLTLKVIENVHSQ